MTYQNCVKKFQFCALTERIDLLSVLTRGFFLQYFRYFKNYYNRIENYVQNPQIMFIS